MRAVTVSSAAAVLFALVESIVGSTDFSHSHSAHRAAHKHSAPRSYSKSCSPGLSVSVAGQLNVSSSYGGPSDYHLVKESSGVDFFDDYDFFTDADPTHGTVSYQSAEAARSAGLVSVGPSSLERTNPALAAFSEPVTARMKVDDSGWLANGEGRKSVRIVSKKAFKHGLLVLDAVKMPYGCSTWPAFWTVGSNWPNGGEIDIVEGVNLVKSNQMTLHTGPGCTLSTSAANATSATGHVLATNCDANVNYNAGCGVQDTTPNSYGKGFNDVGGGVFVMEWTASGISMWHFQRSQIPTDLWAKSPRPSGWGAPAAFWGSDGCDIDRHFGEQNIVFDITLCGDWANAVFNSGGCSGTCADAVKDPSNFKTAEWEVASVRLYQKS